MTNNIQELDKQINELVKQKQKLINEQRNSKLSEAREIIKQFGFTANDLEIAPKPNKKASGTVKTTLEAKYIHPTDKSLVWVGRGAYPKWVKDFLAGGGGLEDLEIKK